MHLGLAVVLIANVCCIRSGQGSRGSLSPHAKPDQLVDSREDSSSRMGDELASSSATAASTLTAASFSSSRTSSRTSSTSLCLNIHMVNITRFYRKYSSLRSGKAQEHDKGEDTVVIEFRTGGIVEIVSSRAVEIMAALIAFAASYDEKRVARQLGLYDVMARALPHTPQARSANNEASIKENLSVIFCSVFPDAKEIPPFESSDWKVMSVFGICVPSISIHTHADREACQVFSESLQRVSDPDVALFPFSLEARGYARTIHVELVALELLSYYSGSMLLRRCRARW